MFRRDANAGSLYWLGLRDREGLYLEGAQQYKLSVPLPVPGKLFWSVTVYDADTRSQIQTAQRKAALRSLFELKDVEGSSVELFFGPTEPLRRREPMDPDTARERLVRLLPHLRTREPRIRRQLETR
jgi:hypothetical protein